MITVQRLVDKQFKNGWQGPYSHTKATDEINLLSKSLPFKCEYQAEDQFQQHLQQNVAADAILVTATGDDCSN